MIVFTPSLVQPVSDREIRLPTDGYHSPNACEQFFLCLRTAGQSGEERPGPRAAGEGSANPEVSLIDQTGTTLSGGTSPEGAATRTAEAATPGFSLN